jgi:hypothetical protein
MKRGFAVLLAIFLCSSVLAEDDTCKEDGGTAYCFGPEVGPWLYQVADAGTGANGLDEAATIAAYKAQYEANLSPYGVCSVTLTDNLPPLPPSSYGSGGVVSGDYTAALSMGIGQYLEAAWTLSTDSTSLQIPLVLHAVYGNACEYTNHHGV